MTEHDLNNDGVNESGRTMMEMLGTLAIIGVLSIGGVSGYGRAINAYRANTIVDTAQKKAMMTSHELTTGSTVTPDINGAMKTPSGYQVTESTPTGTTGDITPDTKYFGVEVGDTTNGGKAVPVEVAKNLLDKALDSWKYVYGFGVKSADGTGNVSWVTKTGSGTGGIDDAIGNNQTVIIILVYAADLSLRPGELLDSVSVTTVDTTPTCTLTTTDCPNGVDTTNCVCKNTAGKTCTSYTTNECGLGYYCKFSPPSSCVRGDGVCTKITGGDDSSGHWVGPKLNWWSANSWCIGKGSSSLITYSTLESEYGCNNSSYSCDWNAFKVDGLTGDYWTAELVDSCDAWEIFGDSNATTCSSNDPHALCE